MFLKKYICQCKFVVYERNFEETGLLSLFSSVGERNHVNHFPLLL